MFRKYQKVEKANVLSEDEHRKVESNLHKLNKTSAADLTDEERKKTFDSIASSR
jgi:ribosome recycling factor